MELRWHDTSHRIERICTDARWTEKEREGERERGRDSQKCRGSDTPPAKILVNPALQSRCRVGIAASVVLIKAYQSEAYCCRYPDAEPTRSTTLSPGIHTCPSRRRWHRVPLYIVHTMYAAMYTANGNFYALYVAVLIRPGRIGLSNLDS